MAWECFNEKENQGELGSDVDQIKEVQQMAHVSEYAAKQRLEKRLNTRLRPRTMEKVDLELKWAVDLAKKSKLNFN